MNFIHLCIVLGIVCTKYTKAGCPNDCSCDLASVICRGSSIVSFPKRFPLSTQSIQFFDTNVTSIPQDAFSNLPNLKILYISNNKNLKTLPSGLFNHTDLKELKVINFNYNSLTSIPDNLLNNLPKLEIILLKRNGLMKLPSNLLRNLPKLRQFIVERNKLASVPGNLFDDSMTEFDYVSFANNHLSGLPSDLFTPVKNSLVSLYLHGNQFRFLPMNAFRIIGSQFNDLNVHLNPTFCNCSLAEFVAWGEGKTHANGVTCNGVNTPLDKINVTNCATTTMPVTTTRTTTRPPSTTQVPLTTTDEATTTKQITTQTQEPSTTGAPFHPRVTTEKPNSTTEPKQPTVVTETDTTQPSTQTATTIPTQETSKPFETKTTQSIFKATRAAPKPGDTETQDTAENKRRKTIIIGVSVTAVVSVVLLALILCLFHTGILSTGRFSKNKVVIYDAEGNVLVTEKEGS